MQQAQQAKQARSIFLHNMSHELRNPMNAVTGFTTLAKKHIDNKQQAAKYLDKVMSAANDLQVLIDNLLDISHIESGKVDISETSCALPDILWELESIVRAEAKIRQLEMSVKCSGLAHENVFCDRQQLSQALMNLIGNALKFTPAGGKISVSLTESQGAPEGYGFYIFKVRDTGIGINKEFLELIFDPFERKHAAIPGGGSGMGLGLAITRNIVETMGGSISVESEEGKGSEFSIAVQFSLA